MTSFGDKVFEGKIDKYPIKGIFEIINEDSSSKSNYFSGLYWYDKIKEPILIHGKILNGEYILEEYGSNKDIKPTAIFRLRRKNNQLIGTWQKVDNKNSLPVTINFTL